MPDGGAGGKVTEEAAVGPVDKISLVGSSVRLHVTPAVSRRLCSALYSFLAYSMGHRSTPLTASVLL